MHLWPYFTLGNHPCRHHYCSGQKRFYGAKKNLGACLLRKNFVTSYLCVCVFLLPQDIRFFFHLAETFLLFKTLILAVKSKKLQLYPNIYLSFRA